WPRRPAAPPPLPYLPVSPRNTSFNSHPTQVSLARSPSPAAARLSARCVRCPRLFRSPAAPRHSPSPSPPAVQPNCRRPRRLASVHFDPHDLADCHFLIGPAAPIAAHSTHPHRQVVQRSPCHNVRASMDEQEFDALFSSRPFGTQDALHEDARARRCALLATL